MGSPIPTESVLWRLCIFVLVSVFLLLVHQEKKCNCVQAAGNLRALYTITHHVEYACSVEHMAWGSMESFMCGFNA